jgi:uncharacterized membrane protein YdjX (TVP38/TMEM64 family)
MLTMVVQMFLFVVPNIFVMMVAILMYGPVFGSIISLAGVFGSSSVGYLIGTKLGPVTIEKLLSKRTLQKATSFIKEYGVAAIAITRVSSLSNDSLSIVAELHSGYNMRYYPSGGIAGYLWKEWKNTQGPDLDCCYIIGGAYCLCYN